MQVSMNVNPYSQVLDNMHRSAPLVARYRNDEDLHVIQHDIARKIENKALHVLIYGAYNSGKSTLINVLLGEPRARVGDVPTTDRVDIFDWNGHRLLDTPGVNAPMEHEEVTADQLARTIAVVLVVREGDQDVMDVYSRLFAMITKKKAIFIILNHQLGVAEEILVASKRIGDVLSRFAADYGVTAEEAHTLPIYPVNLNTAWTGRMRSHAKLLEHSGCTQFEDAFVDWTRRHDNEHHHLSEIKDTVASLWYEPAIDRLAELVRAGDDDDAGPLRELERTLIGQKNRLHGVAYSKADSEVSKIRPDIVELIRDSETKEEADERLKCTLQPVLESIERWLNEELDGIDVRLSVTTEIPEMSGDSSESAEESTAVRDILAGYGNEVWAKIVAAVTDKEQVKEVLVRARGIKQFGIRDILGLKGKWTRTLDKWAGGFTKGARGGVWALQGLTLVWEAKRTNERQKIVNQALREKAVEFQRTINMSCEALRSDLVRDIDEEIENKLGAAIVGVREQLGKIKADLSERDQHYQELLDYRSEMEEISIARIRTESPSEEPG